MAFLKLYKEKLKYKITANRIKWNEKDSTYTMFNFQPFVWQILTNPNIHPHL